jgi:hypothetical protein
MTLVKTTRGTGITKRDFFSICLHTGDPRENARLVREQLQRLGKPFDQFLDEIGAGAAAILSAAKLPTHPDFYALDCAGNWSRVSRSKKGPRHDSVSKIVAPIADAAGFEYDSQEGYAARIVDCIWSIRQARAEGNRDHACHLCIRLGSLLTEFDIKTGTADGPSRGGIKGSESRWGSRDGGKREQMLHEAFISACKGGLPKMAAYAKAARKNAVSMRTVQRAVANAVKSTNSS